MTESQTKLPISAEPTKAFFVDMLTRDIDLEQAVLDLVDNSVDGAKALEGNNPLLPFEGRKIQIIFSKERFEIFDNCGGFDSEAARTYAFRFGSPHGRKERTPHSIGQFGVGMKRALFKFGNHFIVRSATTRDSWAVDVKVQDWERQNDWTFPWAAYLADTKISNENPGTDIVVTELRPEVAARFSTKLFENAILAMIKSKHRQFIAGGLSITVNNHHIDATSLYLLVSDSGFHPGVDEYEENGVKVRIIVGVAHSAPREAGWYVICNGRVILEADRSDTTGWGLVEEESNTIIMPSYHNQFSRFRGIVSFDSNDSALVPWNTTKTDVDKDSSIWQKTFVRMMEMMRPVISFLNELDRDIDEHTKDSSPLLNYVSNSTSVKPEDLKKADFISPARGSIIQKTKTVKIQFSKPVNQVDFLMKELNLSTAKSVGEKSFELIYKEMVRE